MYFVGTENQLNSIQNYWLMLILQWIQGITFRGPIGITINYEAANVKLSKLAEQYSSQQAKIII